MAIKKVTNATRNPNTNEAEGYKYLINCIELYKNEKGIPGKEAYRIFTESGLKERILRCYEALYHESKYGLMRFFEEAIQKFKSTGHE